MKVLIDGVLYRPETEFEKETKEILCEVYNVLWGEGFYDSFNESTRNFARPLAEKMMQLNKILHFKN